MAISYKDKYIKYNQKNKNEVGYEYINQIGGEKEDIKIRLNNGKWIKADNYQKRVFQKFVENRGKKYVDDEKNITIEHREKNQTYIIQSDGNSFPIGNWNNVKIFVVKDSSASWNKTEKHHKWAYYDFIYSNDNKRYYMSKGSKNILGNKKYFEIPDNITRKKNIIFSISFDGGYYIYLNDIKTDKNVLINDNKGRQIGLLSFYTRMTMPSTFNKI
jgi:hypothetical protein